MGREVTAGEGGVLSLSWPVVVAYDACALWKLPADVRNFINKTTCLLRELHHKVPILSCGHLRYLVAVLDSRNKNKKNVSKVSPSGWRDTKDDVQSDRDKGIPFFG